MIERQGEELSELEALVAEGLEHEGQEREAFLERLAERAPDVAVRVNERLNLLGDLGLSVGSGPATPRVVGRFRLVERVGVGGMGEVWRAEADGRSVAVKLVRPELLWFEGARKRFAREARAAAALDHPGVVRLVEFGEENGLPWMALEWVEGCSLDAVLEILHERPPEALGRLDVLDAMAVAGCAGALRTPGDAELDEDGAARRYPELVARMLAKVADALAHAHERGVVHRDVKPSNLLVTVDGEVMLADFGLALTREGSRMTRTGSWLGSLPYAAPEQIDGAGEVDARADVYSLGATLYECLTLRTPFLGGGEGLVRARIATGDLESVRRLNPAVPRALELTLQKAMDPDPRRRYGSARELAEDLRRAARHEPVTARPAPLWLRASRWGRRHPRLAVVGVVLALTLLATAAWAVRERRVAARVRRLADAELVDRLDRESRGLWPPDPERHDAMELWIERADELLSRRALHAAELEALREAALAYDDGQAEADSAEAREFLLGMRLELEGLAWFFEQQGESRERTQPLPRSKVRAALQGWEASVRRDPKGFIAEFQERIDGVREILKGSRAHGELDLTQLTDFQRLLERRGPELSTRRSYRFESDFDQWRHDALVHLLERFDELAHQRERVADLAERSLTIRALDPEVRRAWDETLAAMADSPVYRDVAVEPDPTLLPLRLHAATGLWEFLLIGSGEPPRAAPTEEDPTRFAFGPETGLVLVLLPGGTLEMGIGPGSDLKPSQPRHEVDLDPFYIAKTELGVGHALRLGAVFERTLIDQGGDELPVRMDWMSARELMLAHGFDLPTEAQWEFAARGGVTSHAFPLEGYANVRDRTWELAQPRVPIGGAPYATFEDGYPVLAPIGSFQANGFGLHDTLGNVTEWCREWWVGRGYSTLPSHPGDGLKRTVFSSPGRVARGGSYTSALGMCNPTNRMMIIPGATQTTGVRPVRRVKTR